MILKPSTSPDIWDKVVLDLERQGGMAVVKLPMMQQVQVHKQGFEAVRRELQHPPVTSPHFCIPPNADSAHANGYHGPSTSGSMSRYNAHREGFVFSDGHILDLNEDFRLSMELMFQSMHDCIAQQVLDAIERKWKLPSGWFQSAMGPTQEHSQWHVKRFAPFDESHSCEEDKLPGGDSQQKEELREKDDDRVWLPIHTDPSLISIVLHDAPGMQSGGMGLEYLAPSVDKNEKREWVEIPNHGHCVATVLVGSVLSFMVGSHLVSSAKHRVVYNGAHDDRMAATLFVRPRPTAMLQVPPSYLLTNVTIKKQTNFSTWSSRVARNYQNQKKKKSAFSPRHDGNAGKNNVHDSLYYRDDYSELSLLPCNPPLTGREKYLGGELGSNGKIYTVPGHAAQVLSIDANDEPPTITRIGPKFKGEFKWLRGIRTEPNGIIYAIPCHADCVLRIDPATDAVTTLEWDANDHRAPAKGLPWKWHGGNISPHDGCLYCIPQFAEYVLKLNPFTEELSFCGSALPGKNKYYGGLVGPKDGAIYGINQNATGVLRIDPKTQSTTIHGDFPQGGHKWHGGVLGPDGCIYGIPAHADTVLRVEPRDGQDPIISTIGGPLRTGQHRNDGKYKYLGGAVGLDSMVYFFPSDADYVLQLNPRTQVVREVGPNLRDMEPIHHNKWQNGFTAPDGCMYGIPLKANSVLRIRPRHNEDPEITTIGGPFEGLNSWEGGVMSSKGDMFCMPLNHAMVLRIRPVGKQSYTN